MPYGTLNVDKVVNSDSITSGGLYGFKNRIINGGMAVWQRGTSFSGVTPSLGVTAYTADRWYVAQLSSQSSTDVSQQTTGNTRFAIRVQKRSGSTGASSNILGQVIENLNCLDLPGQQVTLSFTARAGANYSATSNNLAVQIFTCTAADQSSQSFVNGTATGQATLLSQNVTLTTSNQRFTLTTNAVASNATNICLQFVEASSASAAGANDWFEISDVQLERGSTATSFDYRPYGTELALCQRYYCKTFNIGTAPAQNAGTVGSIGFISQAVQPWDAMWRFPVQMRTTPTTVTTYSTNAASANWSTNGDTPTASVIATGESGLAIRASTPAAAGRRYDIQASADAEL